ncbi:hypothetical protein KKF38_05175 [Patescibacteria group bacterium]|nr:hypothetical protein [Patescibacteria group bacterium]
MTFQDLAENLGLSAGGLRVLFCQNKWSIRRPADVQKFFATRFSRKKRQRKTRLPEAANHLQKWQFVKKVKRAEVSPLAEKIKILEEKLAQESALAAEKERKIETLTRQIKDTEESVAELRQARTEPKVQQNIEKNEPQIAEKPAPNFGTVPSAESRKEAARTRREEKMVNEKPIEKIEPVKVPVAVEPEKIPKTPEIKTEEKVESVKIPVEKVVAKKVKSVDISNETPPTEISALRAEIREQIGKIEIAEIATVEVFAEIPNEVGDENFRPAMPTEEPEPEPEIPIVENIVEPITPETPEPKPAPIPEPKPETIPEPLPTLAEEIPVEKVEPEVAEVAPAEVVPAEKVEVETAPPNPPN